ncbi:MAG: DUF4468 domain-containing protein [Ferruginibacter sp.]|nr:DUF4468 domain-containing protein [Cytophagales bacterium]
MKTFICFLLLSFVLPAQAQTVPIDRATRKVAFKETVLQNEITQKELYSRALRWCEGRYRATRELPKRQRKLGLPLVNNAYHNIYIPTDLGPQAVRMYYTLEIVVDEKGYRYCLSNIYYRTYADRQHQSMTGEFSAELIFGEDGNQTAGNLQALSRLYYAATHQYAKQLLTDLKTAMNPDHTMTRN